MRTKQSTSPEMFLVPPKCQEEEKSARDEWLEAFEADFWKQYPRKVGKFVARKAFLRIKPWNQDACDQIFAGLDRWCKYWDDNEIESRFIPYPATWLNQHRWEDEPE